MTNICVLLLQIPQVYKLTENHTTTHVRQYSYDYYLTCTTLKMLHDVAWFSTDYKNLCTRCSLTF